MKILLITAFVLMGICGVAWLTYPWEYSEAQTEAAFQKLVTDGFDKKTAFQLIKQYQRSDASFRTHFLALGYFARLKNKAAFDASLNEWWATLVTDITDHGEMAAEDWFGSKKFQELKRFSSPSP